MSANHPQTAGFDEPLLPGEVLPTQERRAPPAVQQHGGLPAETGLVDGGETGMEGTRQAEKQFPGLRIIQSNSPQLKRGEPAYDPDAKPGDILNNATGERWEGEKGLDIVIFGKDYHYGEWIPIDDGGGFRGMHMPDERLVQDLIRQYGRFKPLPWVNGNGEKVELVETGQLFTFYGDSPIAAETAQPAYISLSSTMMPVYQRWLSRHAGWRYKQQDGSMKEAALWAYVWRLTTAYQSKGQYSWFVFRLEPVGGKPMESLTAVHDRALFGMAKSAFDDFRAGMIKAAQDEQQPGEDREEVPM